MFFRLVYESFNFAWQALKSNMLRTILSLLGVTVGIFAIIAVFTIVDAMEKNIKESMSFLGDKVIYVQKWPWVFNGNFAWWKYYNRPVVKYNEYKMLEKVIVNKKAVAIFDQRGNVTLKNKNNSMKGCFVQGVSSGYEMVSDVPLETGRFFIPSEQEAGKNVVIIGAEVSNSLFPNNPDPLGKSFKLKGVPFVVIGILKKQGANLLGINFDNVAYIPYKTFEKLFSNKFSSPNLAFKGLDNDEGLLTLEAELTGVMRSLRGLKPTQENNFSFNRPEMAANAIGSIFGVLNFAAAIIGSFSILVGAFGIANIMFVSVKERTNIIGIQKSLGAKNYFILFQFLFEAVFLSLLGGAIGLFIVYLITLIPQDSLAMSLTIKNISIGLGISTVVGVLSGIIPAGVAAKLDPVIAIRSK